MKGRIFISYRRSDAQGVAGRLSDTLEKYFGDKRVFRDIEDITGGADFGKVIGENLESADAMIVLMGRNWLEATSEDGTKRLHAPNDWVSSEISAAIEKGIPVFPVLIEDTPMPREEELPEKLKPMLRFNALNVSDVRWEYDVQRLAKIISLDMPSASELKLEVVRFLISMGLSLSLIYSTVMLSLHALRNICSNSDAADSDTNEKLCELSDTWESLVPDKLPKLIELWQAGVPYVAIIASSLALFSVVNLIAKERQRYIYASIGVGALGTFFFFSMQIFQGPYEEPIIGFFGTVLIICSMFVFMNISGFKAK